MNRRDCLKAGLSLAGFACELLCGSWWGGQFDGYCVGEKLPSGQYVIHRTDMPPELSKGHATVTVEDSIKARTIRDYERALLHKQPDGTWTVEARE